MPRRCPEGGGGVRWAKLELSDALRFIRAIINYDELLIHLLYRTKLTLG